MPAYSFKEQFVQMVIDGTKVQTIRARRAKGFAKRRDSIYLYYGMRTKHCTKIGEGFCNQASTVLITDKAVFIWGDRLSDDDCQFIIEQAKEGKYMQFYEVCDEFKVKQKELDRFAFDDGFRPKGSSRKNCSGAWKMMIDFWKKNNELPFIGDLIYWDLNLSYRLNS